MTDKYKALREALEAGPAAWISQNTMTGDDRYARVPIQSLQPGVYTHTPLYSIDPETVLALLEERDRMKAALETVVRVFESDDPAICDTVWVPQESNGHQSPQTLYDLARESLGGAE